jgi:hypothetical protein
MGETFVVEREVSSGLWLPKTEERPSGAAVSVEPDSVASIDGWVEEASEALEEAEGFSL